MQIGDDAVGSSLKNSFSNIVLMNFLFFVVAGHHKESLPGFWKVFRYDQI